MDSDEAAHYELPPPDLCCLQSHLLSFSVFSMLKFFGKLQ